MTTTTGSRASNKGPDRLVGLDAWRAMLMLAGLLVHSSLWLAPVPVFRIFGDLSQVFRMGTFFAIAGFLSFLSLRRRGLRRWMTGRLIQLGVPMLFGMLVVSPIIWLTVGSSAEDVVSWALLPIEPHHCWFLIGLIICSEILVVIECADRRWAFFDRAATALGTRGAPMLVAVCAAASAFLLAFAVDAFQMFGPRALAPNLGNLQFIAAYLPMFLMGYALARSPALLEQALGATRLATVICSVGALTYLIVPRLAVPAIVVTQVQFVVMTVCPPAAFLLILRSALSIQRVPWPLVHISRASFTIYVLHYPIALILNSHLGGGLDPHVAFVLTMVSSGCGAFAAHVLFVERWPVAAFLLNGKMPRKVELRSDLSPDSSVTSYPTNAIQAATQALDGLADPARPPIASDSSALPV